MKPAGFDNLSAEDAAAILELSLILDIAFVKPIGASERKFYIETKQGIKRLLRITPIKGYKWVKDDDRVYEYMASAGINVPRQVSEGFFAGGEFVYQLWTWIDGEDLYTALPRMSHAEQFAAGIKSGEAARKIHSLPPIYEPEPWEICYRRKVEDKIQAYNNSHTKSQSVDLLVRYLQDNMELLANRPTTFTKGDWNTRNLMITPDNKIWLIDIGDSSGDPWSEFWEISGDADEMPQYYTGLIKGYFEGEPPVEYFPLFVFYMASETLSWGYDSENVLNWFDDMRNPVPTWYLKDYNG
ncbi:MAG: aminoglycoside phosphotransferase family protein [Oscillospiraceae bacterium]|nr:aminoglycoside phosphotransferase family protein [Oscillospiraceae bacterium]